MMLDKIVHFGEFLKKSAACGQIALPERSLLIRQKLVEIAKIKKFKCDILSYFQTMWSHLSQFLVKKHSVFLVLEIGGAWKKA